MDSTGARFNEIRGKLARLAFPNVANISAVMIPTGEFFVAYFTARKPPISEAIVEASSTYAQIIFVVTAITLLDGCHRTGLAISFVTNLSTGMFFAVQESATYATARSGNDAVSASKAVHGLCTVAVLGNAHRGASGASTGMTKQNAFVRTIGVVGIF